MGACFDRLRCEVFQNLFLSPMNTGFVRPAVATVLTVYGIETIKRVLFVEGSFKLQQYLPFTVLKRKKYTHGKSAKFKLQQYLPFTVLKLRHNYGRTTNDCGRLQQYLPFTVLKRHSNSTWTKKIISMPVATVLTVYGIETLPLS